MQNGTNTLVSPSVAGVDTPLFSVNTFVSAGRYVGYMNGKIEGTTPIDPAATVTIADAGDFAVMAYTDGAVMGDYRIGEFFLSRAALTPTEVLVHACRVNAKYGIPVA